MNRFRSDQNGRPTRCSACWICGVAVIALCFGDAASAAAETPSPPTCHMLEIGEIPIAYHDGQITLDADIDGHPARMVVDTGSAATIMSREAATEFGLKTRGFHDVKFYGVGGIDTAELARVEKFSVAGLAARNFEMVVTGRHGLGDAKGLIGAGFLLQADVEFDVPEGKLRFFQPRNCRGDQVVYWGSTYSVASITNAATVQKIDVTVHVNGNAVQAEMDTGSDRTVVTPGVAYHAGVTEKSPGAVDGGVTFGIGAQAVKTYSGVFQSFAFGDEVIKNARLQVADLFHADQEVELGSRLARATIEEPQMLLGADFFRSHRVYVAMGQRKVYVSYMGGPVFKTVTVDQTATPKAGQASGK